MLRILFFAIAISIAFASCVPMRQFQELKNQQEACKSDRDSLKAINESLTVENTEIESEVEILRKRISDLNINSALLEDTISLFKSRNDYLMNEKESLLEQQQKILEGNNRELRLLMTDLQKAKDSLQIKEDNLKMLELQLEKKEENLNQLQTELDNRNSQLDELEEELRIKKEELEKQSQQLFELQKVLDAKDSVVLALKNKVTEALLGFQDKGLTVDMRNGKVYVSLEEKLLFKFGSSDIDPNGEKALKELAKVLEQNTDINILIEGHTDNIGDKNYNWDLSVKRATSVVKVITKYSKIDPKRLTAAGKGQFMPVDAANTDAARRKNRRTEIILTPKLDELLKILENN
jgi:chemotaxis protein MotB